MKWLQCVCLYNQQGSLHSLHVYPHNCFMHFEFTQSVGTSFFFLGVPLHSMYFSVNTISVCTFLTSPVQHRGRTYNGERDPVSSTGERQEQILGLTQPSQARNARNGPDRYGIQELLSRQEVMYGIISFHETVAVPRVNCWVSW